MQSCGHGAARGLRICWNCVIRWDSEYGLMGVETSDLRNPGDYGWSTGVIRTMTSPTWAFAGKENTIRVHRP